MESDQQEGRSLPSEGERPTLKTIAFMTGLGVTTVSRALKDAPEIGPETRKRVQLVARQVGYRPNRAGVRLRTGKTNVISLILDTQESIGGFVSDIVYGVSEHLAQTPYHLILTPYSRDNDPMEPIRYVVETGSADGIIISRTQPNDPRVRYLAERGFPFATHGRTLVKPAHAFHDFDNYTFGQIAVQRLVRRGRKRLALLGPSASLLYAQHTRDGFSDALASEGVSEVPFPHVTTDDTMEAIREATLEMMRRKQPPDGIVSSAGGAAFSIVAGIEEAGLQLGRDIDIVSKQSFRLLPIFRPQILVVNEDFRLAGRNLARAVIGAIGGAALNTLQTIEVPEAVGEVPEAVDETR
ncbi:MULTISPECIES: LacI family transcriptional regulator [Mesorhizobium]|uniref:LacI family DNA-binding transcriptional regulator n=1 Tax=Mesorhizobium denitrificans TaxID=2294114 RepID=A0A371XCP1_9HYPH|nr:MULTISPECIES: LacI family transcriptional regulator [Mesorhizobium]RFC66963.1 LacI family DNA-binding transcriptional regulator [Mesorhizobium denitrificans]